MTITVTIDKRFTCISDLYLKHQHHQRLINRLLLCTQTSDGKPEALGEQTVCYCSLPFSRGQKFVFLSWWMNHFLKNFQQRLSKRDSSMGICERSTLLTVADGTCHFLLKERKNKEINGKSCNLEVIADGIGYLNIQ